MAKKEIYLLNAKLIDGKTNTEKIMCPNMESRDPKNIYNIVIIVVDTSVIMIRLIIKNIVTDQK